MIIHISSSILLYTALAILSATTILIILLTTLLYIKEHFRPPSYRPLFTYWLLAHRLQNYLALLNLTEILFLLTTFPIISIDRANLCRTELRGYRCRGLRNTWKGVASGLAVLSVCSMVVGWPMFRYLYKRDRSPHFRYLDVLNNRPYALTTAHIILQSSSVLTLVASFSDLFFPDGNVYAALRCSMFTGAFAIVCFDFGVLVTFWGVLRYSFSMRAMREEARERRFVTSRRFGWGRGVAERVFYNRRTAERMIVQMDYISDVMWERVRAREGARIVVEEVE